MVLVQLAVALTALFICQIGATEELVPSIFFARDAELVRRTDDLVSAVCNEMETSELRWNGRFISASITMIPGRTPISPTKSLPTFLTTQATKRTERRRFCVEITSCAIAGNESMNI
jgi:hypothetical protein